MKTIIMLLLLVSSAFAETLTYDFNQGSQGWAAHFADYPAGDEEFFELDSGVRKLPAEISTTRSGFLISGNNHSDDLYMYLTREFQAVPGDTYRVKFTVTFDSNAPSNCAGTGGAPGESVIMNGNVLNVEPETFVDELNHIRTTFDHGTFISNLANGIECEDSKDEYVSLTRTQSMTKTIRVGKSGKLWFVVGTDSGFESTTAIYYEKILVNIQHAR